MIDPGVILMWAGNNGSIPSGWQRETSLDSKYVKGWGSQNPDNTGGSNTHSHTDGGHSHSMQGHSHSYKLDEANDQILSYLEVSGYDRLVSKHDHGTASTSSTSGGSLKSTTVTWSSTNQEPPYYEVIYIKPNDNSMGDIADGIISLFSGDSVPSGWNYCNGNDGTPDLRNRFLKGASNGANAGGTGGSTSHQHTVSHTHSANSHTHSGTSAGDNNIHGYRQGWAGDNNYAKHTHYHSVSLHSTTAGVNTYSKTNAGSGDTVQPEYVNLGAIEATSSGTVANGIVGLWLGSTGSLPDGWVVSDGNNGTYNLQNKYIKIGGSLSNNGDTGGSNTHDHSDISHTHSASGTHSHGGSTGSASSCRERSHGADGVVPCSHTHDVINVSSRTASFNSSNINCNSVNNEPAYRTAAYIEFQGKLLLGGMI